MQGTKASSNLARSRAPHEQRNLLRLLQRLGRGLPNLKGRHAVVSKIQGALVQQWPADSTVVSSEGISFVHCDLNEYIFQELFLYGVHELDVDWMLRQLLRPGDTVFDAGASFGFHALTSAQRVGPEGHVYGAEPQPDMFDLLQQNLTVNGICNVTVSQIALGDAPAKIELHRFAGLDTGHTSVATLGRDDYETIECKATTLDEYCELHGIKTITALKLDVEGSELPILKGAIKLLASPNPPLCIVEINMETTEACGYHPNDILSFLKRCNYSFYRPVRGWFARNILRVEPCEFIHHGDNILCAVWPTHKERLAALGITSPPTSLC